MSGEVKGSDNAAGWFILAVLFFILLSIVWYFFQYDVRSIMRYLHFGEMWLVSWFVGDNYSVPWREGQLLHSQWVEVTPDLQKGDISGDVSNQIAIVALYPMRWVISGLLILMGLWALFKGPRSHYRRTHSMDTLINFQSKLFPYIKPFTKFNPSNQPPRPPGSPVPAELPLFAEALGPEEWLAFNGVPVPDGDVDQDAAARKFSKQLGRPWRGYAHLPEHKQVLLAAFCLKAARKRSDADDLLGNLAECWSDKKGLVINRKTLTRARKVLKNRELSGKTISLCNQHAYENTALMRGLLYAREEGGVLAPSQFVWLRAHDRNLWYPLNNLGRQTFHMEALGATSHFRHEKLTQRPILRPRIEDAVQSITNYMNSDRARPIPALDYSHSKRKRGIKKLKISAK